MYMKIQINKIIKIILDIVAIILICFNLFIELMPNTYMDTKVKVFTYIFPIILFFIEMKFENKKIINEQQKQNNRQTFLKKAFIIYSILLATLLLTDGNYRRLDYGNTNIKLFSKQHFEMYSNFIPFSTIYSFFERSVNDTINNNIVIVNIIGNIIAFSPYGIFIPMIFKEKFSNIKTFLLFMIGIVFIFECIQFITMNGTFDIDDIILNVLGAMIVFKVAKIKEGKYVEKSKIMEK